MSVEHGIFETHTIARSISLSIMKKKPPNFIIVLSLPSACEKSVSDIGQNTEISDSEHNDDKFDFFPLA